MKIKLSMKWKVINSLLGVLCCFAFAACNQDMMPEDDTLRTSANAGTVYMQDFIPDRNAAVGAEVTLTDKRDNQVYRCIKMADGRWWMGENLKYNVTGSVFYNNEAANLETYGRLYKWQEATGAIPENWDMPSDDEWKALEMALGMTQEDADAITAWRNSGNVGTQLKESSGMGLLLSGYQHTNGTFFYLGTYGRYWTSTEASSANALDRDVYSTKAGVYRGSFGKAYRYAVRCILKETNLYMQTFVPNPADTVGTEVMLTDKRDNIVYRCIKMADGRWWMGENLRGRFGTFVEGQPTETYGLLYDWDSSKDYAPEGWSLPTNAEWTALVEALGGPSIAGGKMKSTTPDWLSPNIGADNSSGWNGLPGGNISNGNYYDKGGWGNWWSTESYTYWGLYYNAAYMRRPYTGSSSYLRSVRCILQERETTQYMQTFVPNPADSVGTEVMLTDKRDSIVYRCIKMADGRWWMGENLKYNSEGSLIYDNDTANLVIYGRLYDWDSSKDYIPEGWSLPSDDEWNTLEMALGMAPEDTDKDGERGTDQGTQLKEGGSSGLDLLLGGCWLARYTFLRSQGGYWSSTENSLSVQVRVVNRRLAGVTRATCGKTYRLSVRCIKNR